MTSQRLLYNCLGVADARRIKFIARIDRLLISTGKIFIIVRSTHAQVHSTRCIKNNGNVGHFTD